MDAFLLVPWVWMLLCYRGTLEAFQMPAVLSEDQPFGVTSPPVPQYNSGSTDQSWAGFGGTRMLAC